MQHACAAPSAAEAPHPPKMALLLLLLEGAAANRATRADIATIQPTTRTTVANSLWGNDAFPGSPPVRECGYYRLPAMPPPSVSPPRPGA